MQLSASTSQRSEPRLRRAQPASLFFAFFLLALFSPPRVLTVCPRVESASYTLVSPFLYCFVSAEAREDGRLASERLTSGWRSTVTRCA